MESLSHLMNHSEELNQDVLSCISSWANALSQVDEDIQQAEKALETLKNLRREIAQDHLPSIIYGSGLSQIRLADGRVVRVQQKISPTVKDMSGLAALLEERGESNLLKTVLEVGKLSAERVDAVRQKIYDLTGTVPDIKQSIHPMTLKKWVKETYAAGDEVDVNAVPPCLSVYVYSDTTVKTK